MRGVTEWLATVGPSRAQRNVAVCARAFFSGPSWAQLVNDPSWAKLVDERDDTSFQSSLVKQKESKTRMFKSRYQGTGTGHEVAARLSSFDWTEFQRGARARRRSWASCEAELVAAGGRGVAAFLGGKMLLGLCLAGLAPPTRDDAATLGPGAKVSAFLMFRFKRTGDYVPSYRIKEKDLQSDALAGVDLGAYMNSYNAYSRIGELSYWASELKENARLKVLDEAMRTKLSADHPSITAESKLCEVLRRRCAALAFTAKVIKVLPKGGFRKEDRKAFAARAMSDDAPSIWEQATLYVDNDEIKSGELEKLRAQPAIAS